jgi:hypothetical protein
VTLVDECDGEGDSARRRWRPSAPYPLAPPAQYLLQRPVHLFRAGSAGLHIVREGQEVSRVLPAFGPDVMPASAIEVGQLIPEPASFEYFGVQRR